MKVLSIALILIIGGCLFGCSGGSEAVAPETKASDVKLDPDKKAEMDQKFKGFDPSKQPK